MLQQIRDSIGRWIAGIILGLIAVAFVFWGVDFSLTGTTFAAKVNGENIPLMDFERELQSQQNQYQQLYRSELSEELRRELRRNVVERLVRTEALSQRVEGAGYRISDERLTEYIRSRPAFQVDDEFSMDIYRGQLLNQGLSPAGFEALQREQLRLLELQNGIADSTFLTPAEFRRYIELFYQQRQIAYALFEVDDFLKQVEVDAAAVIDHYQANKDRYRSEETVDLEYVEIQRADIAAGIDVTEAELEAYYDEERYRYQTEEERRARHILIASTEEDADAEARARAVVTRLESGEDFAAVAAQVSEDPGTGAQGGDLGWIGRGMLAGAFEDVLFSMQVGEVRGPVKTQFGYHVIRLEEIRSGDVQPFETVREELLGEYRSRRAEEIFYEQANELADRAFDAYDELATVATEMNLPLQTLTAFPRSGDPEVFANSAPVAQAAFSEDVLTDGANSPLVELGDDHVLVLRVTAHHPSTERPLEVVREQIVDELARAEAERLAAEAADMFLSGLAEGEQGAAALAEALGGAWTAPAWVERTSPNVRTEVLATAFRLGRPAGNVPVRRKVPLASGAQAVLVLSAVRSGQPDTVSREERDQRQRQLADQVSMYELSSYAAEVREQATVRIPEEILNPPAF